MSISKRPFFPAQLSGKGFRAAAGAPHRSGDHKEVWQDPGAGEGNLGIYITPFPKWISNCPNSLGQGGIMDIHL